MCIFLFEDAKFLHIWEFCKIIFIILSVLGQFFFMCSLTYFNHAKHTYNKLDLEDKEIVKIV